MPGGQLINRFVTSPRVMASRPSQIACMAQLGRVEPDASGKPLLMMVTNQQDDTTAPEGELPFHYDYAYDPNPVTAISLYGFDVRKGVTPTRFANSFTVLSRLSQGVLERLKGREAAHFCFLEPDGVALADDASADPDVARGEPGWGPEHWCTRHPAVWRNEAGVPTLFLCDQHTHRILGMPRSESDELLREVYAELYSPDEVYDHMWEPGDLVIWDNFSVQHARPEPSDQPRILRRYHVSSVDLTEIYLEVGRSRSFL